MPELTGKQRRYLRSLAHHLKPVVQVGNAGVSESLVEKVHEALEDHELIKVKVGENSPEPASEVGGKLAAACGAHVAQTIGRTIVLYRRRKEDPEITLPTV